VSKPGGSEPGTPGTVIAPADGHLSVVLCLVRDGPADRAPGGPNSLATGLGTLQAASMTTTFANARKGLDEVRASVWDYKLVDLLAEHGEQEGALLARYESLAAGTTSPAVRYLGQLILDDERRHHRMLVEMANAIAWGWSKLSPEPAVPELPAPQTVDQELVETAQALLRIERRDQAELKKLRKELDEVADTTLWALLVDLMRLDTEKHIRILRFLTDHVRG
jgi:hypothetical protein